jgi:hypothetical protein
VAKEGKLQLNMSVTLEKEEEYYLRRSIEQLEQRHGQRM